MPVDKRISAKAREALTEQWRAELNKRIETLTHLRDDTDGCIGCGCLSMRDCPLRNPNDRLAEEGTGAILLDPQREGSSRYTGG